MTKLVKVLLIAVAMVAFTACSGDSAKKEGGDAAPKTEEKAEDSAKEGAEGAVEKAEEKAEEAAPAEK